MITTEVHVFNCSSPNMIFKCPVRISESNNRNTSISPENDGYKERARDGGSIGVKLDLESINFEYEGAGLGKRNWMAAKVHWVTLKLFLAVGKQLGWLKMNRATDGHGDCERK